MCERVLWCSVMGERPRKLVIADVIAWMVSIIFLLFTIDAFISQEYVSAVVWGVCCLLWSPALRRYILNWW